jgi:simple sugar transport system ATP-binding protein
MSQMTAWAPTSTPRVGWAATSTLARREAGIGFVPEDRQRDGMVLGMSLWENVLLGHQGSAAFSARGLVDRDAARRRTEAVVQDFDVRTPSIDVRAFTLSGGNQQKLIVGREMRSEPIVLVAAHPTRGVDVGAQAVIWDILRDARAAGLATLLVSADLEELIGLSDRLLVMLRGHVVAELDPAAVSQADLGCYMTGVKVAGQPDEPPEAPS